MSQPVEREKLEQRLRELKAEFESGQKMMADLEFRQANLKETLLRISGAIQVLEEFLAQELQPTGDEVDRIVSAGEQTESRAAGE
jgi:predicted nuclease with TOPRIM domain